MPQPDGGGFALGEAPSAVEARFHFFPHTSSGLFGGGPAGYR